MDEAEHETTEEPIDEEGKNFDDIKAPVGAGSSSRGMSSQVSTLSSFSMASDGIPIRAGDDIDGDDDEELQYEWSTEGEREITEQEIEPERDSPPVDQELLPVHLDHGQRVEEVAEEFQESDLEEEPVRRSREASGEPGQDSEPGYDLDDDGLPGAPLPPLQQSEDLYPSQELDESFHVIERGEVYRHIKNLKVDSFLTACLVLTFALVVGLGLGHFLGLGPLSGLSVANGDEFLNDFKSINDFEDPPQNQEEFNDRLMMEAIDPTPFSLFASIKNSLTRLGQKFGYLKKNQGQDFPGAGPGYAPGSDPGFAFQCMAADDTPILVDGQPVMVVDPGDCHQYYLQNLDPTIAWTESGGYPAPIVEPPPPVFLEAAKLRFRSDDQDLDDRVIRQLWEDNKELREEVTQLRKNTGDDADEAMAAILRDRINDLLTANADLEREVARLRYADAARGAAESVETLDKLRQTRDTLNDILTENDQLKIEVAKARYGEPPLVEQTSNEVDPEQVLAEQLVAENR